MNSIKKKTKKKQGRAVKTARNDRMSYSEGGGGVNQSGLYVLCIRLNPCDLKVHCRSDEKAF